MIRTYLDSGLLIAAARAQPQAIQRLEAVLRDPERVFAASLFICVLNRKAGTFFPPISP